MDDKPREQVEVESTRDKGRVLKSKARYEPGDLIFREKAWVYATWNEEKCIVCNVEHENEAIVCPKVVKCLGQEISDQLDEIMDFLSDLDAIGEVDIARCVFKSLTRYNKSPEEVLDTLNLSFSNLEQCIEAANAIQNNYPQIIPAGFTLEQVAKLIAVLNNNTHTLEHFEGSGLFKTACIMEHSCAPSCNYTTFGNELWVTAIKTLEPGDALSIDYGNFFYRPRHERQATLMDSYGFKCMCKACTEQPDLYRGFCCGATSKANPGLGKKIKNLYKKAKKAITSSSECNGFVCLHPESLDFVWKCTECGISPSQAEVEYLLAVEEHVLEKSPESLLEWEEMISWEILHPTHYAFFWALDMLGCSLAENPFSSPKMLKLVWENIVELMESVVPMPNSEKIIYYDNLAQVRVVLGDIESASEAYSKAHEISCIVSGKDTESTAKLLELATKTPRTREEITKLYAHEQDRVSCQDDEF